MRRSSMPLILLMSTTLGFVPQSKLLSKSHRSQSCDKQRDTSMLNLLWFGNDGKKQEKEETRKDAPKKSRSKMGSTANTMENFKQSQELGKKTSALLNELSAANVEGVAAKGRIKVTIDGKQRPKLVELDEEYFNGVAMEELTEALTVAMQDAHDKSTKLMEERMSGLYADLGLPLTKQ